MTVPTLPTFPDGELDWSSCTGADCFLYDATASDNVDPSTVNMPFEGGYPTSVSNSLTGRYANTGYAANANGVKLVVRSLDNVTGVVFAAGNWSNNYGPGKPTETENYTASNNTLVVELSNRDGTAASLGPSSDYAAFAAAIGDEFSNVDGNSLLIRNTALTQATNGEYLGITTAYASEITNVDAQQQLEKGSMSSNLLVLDNVLVTRDESFTNTNIRLGAVHLLNKHRHKDQMSDVDLNDNRVFIRDSDITAYSIYAAMVEAGVQTYQTIDASGNQIVIDGSDIKLGGKWGEAVSQGNPAIATTVKTSNATSNELFLNNSTITLNYAGVADDSQKTTILSSVYGATAANNNTTVLTDVDILVNGTPAQTDEGQLQSVLIAGASATTVGFSNATTANAANGNSLYVIGSTKRVNMGLEGMQSILSAADIVVTQSADLQGTVSGNKTYVQNADLGKTSIYGGRARGYTSGQGVVSQGTALVSNNEVLVQDISADEATLVGGFTIRGETSSNAVTVEGADITKALLVGGSAEERGTASQNTVTVSASTLGAGSSIYGGFVKTGDAGNTAENNTVILGADVTGTGGSVLQLDALYGGYAQTAVDGANVAYTGNTLYTATRLVTQELGGFQHYQFVTTQEQLDAGALVEVTGSKAVVLQADGDQHSTVAIGGTDITFEVGSAYTLIDSAAGFEDLTGQKLTAGKDLSGIKTDMVVESLPSVIRIDKTTFTKDDYDLSIVDGTNGDQSLVIDIAGGGSTSSEINSETDALMESSLSTLTTHFAADDLFVDAVLRSRDGKRDGLFTAARGGKWSYDTRTRIENNIVSGLLGYGAKLSNDLTMGAFIEMGHGSYDTRSHVAGSTKAGGGSHNYGGLGVFGDYAMPSIEGLHFTGYLKVGLLRNEFNSNIAGANVDYDRTGVYWGAHLGTHYDWDLTQSIRSRVFLSYFYDGQGDESFDIAGEGDVGGAHVSYDAIHAHRVQLGSMFEFAVSDTWRPYLGLTFEQILAAEAKGTATDAQGTMDLNSSDLEGSTGILSAGWTYQDGNFSTELGLNGYAGTRNGVSGQIQANWKF